MSIRSKLQEMKNLLSTKDKWTSGTFARDKNNLPTDDKYKATCFCLLGARKFVFSDASANFLNTPPPTEESYNLYNHMVDNLDPKYLHISTFNDQASFEEIHQYLDKCIETAPQD